MVEYQDCTYCPVCKIVLRQCECPPLEGIIGKLKKEARDSWGGDIGDQRADKLEKFLRALLPGYAEKLGLTESEILEAIEKKRDYSAINYYQEANFPSLDGVNVFNDQAELKAAIPGMQFRCPCCKAISTDPYTCNSGAPMGKSNKICDWKSWGLMRTMGEGYRFTIIDSFLENPRIDEIFMPLEFEKAA